MKRSTDIKDPNEWYITYVRNKALAEKYPFLLPRNAWTGEVVEDYDYSWTELDAIPEGWRKVYGILICEDIVRTLGDHLDQFRFVQIKEKWGALRLYDNGATKEWYEQLGKYEHLTGNTCIECGKVGVPMTDTGWLLPMCEDCYNKAAESRKKKGWGNVQSYNEVIEEGYEFSPAYIVRGWSKEAGDYERVVDCTDILERVDPQYLTDEVGQMISKKDYF